MIAGLTFLYPLALLPLLALPLLYFLLRITPPPPRRLPLPTLPLVKDILGKEREPSRTPWWLMLIRLAAAAAVILAAAGPRIQPDDAATPGGGTGPLILLIDDGWPAARDWSLRIDRAAALIDHAQDRPFVLIPSGEERPSLAPEAARPILAKLLSLRPRPHAVPRAAGFERAETALATIPNARLIWISDGIAFNDEQGIIQGFLQRVGNRLEIHAVRNPDIAAIAGIAQNANGLEAILKRAGRGPTGSDEPPGVIRALDEKGRLLGETTFGFGAGNETRARLPMPIELVNDISRLEVADARHAGAVHLVDSANRRRRVALITGETTDTAQPLVSGRFFVSRALAPYSDLREPPRGVTNPIQRALEERPDVLVLVDVGTLSGENADSVTRFVENGGMLIRFAGPGLAAAGDALLPVRLRRGGRVLGGALSWDKPRKLGAFPETSPFAGLKASEDIRVERQVLAEPDSDLIRASWAVLEDGTPLVTGMQRGKGQIVLFHVTGDPNWSNLPLSGAFVDMLRRCLLLAKRQVGASAGPNQEGNAKLNPRLVLDGFGVLSGTIAEARPVDPRFTEVANRDHPPGFYGPIETSLSVNAVTAATQLGEADFANNTIRPLTTARIMDFRPLLMLIAVALLIADALAVLLMGGGLVRLAGGQRAAGLKASALAISVVLLALATPPSEAQQSDLRNIRPEDIRSSLRPRLAYVITGDARVDEASRAGLTGLGQILTQRTSLHLDEPIGLDPARDELVFYSMIYWPIIANQPRPSDRAVAAIDTFMKQGGTMVFDTRDAFIQRPGGQITPETRALRQMLSTLDIPALEPIPADHVMTKTFYLLDKFVGRYAAGDTWVEVLAGRSDAKTPARAGDRVSPIVITSNDLAAAWAVDRVGNPLYPLVPGEPRQREMAFRTGVNLVMYVMTGNYKSDQVHVEEMLKRLGQ